jgi:hypothetical protein
VNLPELLKRAYWGTVTQAELSEVVRLITEDSSKDLNALIQILGRAGSPKYRKIVEPFLLNVGNPQLSALALKVLCWSWGLAREYRETLLDFLKGVDWDDEDYVRLAAISAAGEYLRKTSDNELLQVIYDTFSDQRERPLIRASAYCALCRSEKLEWKEILPAPRIIDSSKEIDMEVLERVEQKLGRRIR